MTVEPEPWLPRAAQEAWTVPEMPEDMKESVMSQMDEQWTLVGPPNHQPPPVSSGMGIAAICTAGVALVASAAAIALAVLTFDDPEPPPAQAPLVVADVPPQAGQLTISVDPPAAICRLDGVELEGPSPCIATDITPGDHEVLVELEGYRPWQRTVSVPDQQLHLPVVLEPAAHEDGHVAPVEHEAPHVDDADDDADDQDHVLADPFRRRAAGKRVPRVRASSANVKGALDKDIIRQITRAHINEVRHCYNQGLVRDPDLSGRVSIQFTIGPTGKVPVAVVDKTTLPDRAVATCIAKAVKRWKFPPPEGGGNVVVTYPFVLQPG